MAARTLARILLGLSLALPCGCDDDSGPSQSPSPSPSVAAADEAPEERPDEANWQLIDDSDFTATVTPWPLSQGATATIRGVASSDDNDEKFKGTVSYRVVTDENDPTTPWAPMMRVRSVDPADTTFVATTTAPKAPKAWIQFELKQDSDDGETDDLTDWSIPLAP